MSVLDKAWEHLGIARIRAMRSFPYFRAGFMKLVPIPTPGLGTVAVTEHCQFLFDPEFWVSLSLEEAEFALCHEFYHVLMAHHKRRGDRDMFLWNISGDLVINQLLRDARLTLTQGAAVPERYQLERNLTTEAYYDALQQKAEQERKQAGDSNDSQEGGESAASSDERSQRTSKAEQNSDAQSANESASDGDGKSTSYEGEFAGGCCGSGAGHKAHDEPGAEEDGRSEASVENMRRQVAHEVKSYAAKKGRGSVPEGLQRWAEIALTPPKIRWQTRLARLAKRALAFRPGAVDYRFSKPSRRQLGLGQGMGVPILPGLITPIPRVAVVLDTSGSMGNKEVEEALVETAGILKAVGADVDFCSCDASVHTLQSVSSPRQLMGLVKGGGGTDFRPAFDALQKRKPRPEVVVFATDGCGPAPEIPPRGMHTIWLLIGPYRRRPCEWGTFIDIDEVA